MRCIRRVTRNSGAELLLQNSAHSSSPLVRMSLRCLLRASASRETVQKDKRSTPYFSRHTEFLYGQQANAIKHAPKAARRPHRRRRRTSQKSLRSSLPPRRPSPSPTITTPSRPHVASSSRRPAFHLAPRQRLPPLLPGQLQRALLPGHGLSRRFHRPPRDSVPAALARGSGFFLPPTAAAAPRAKSRWPRSCGPRISRRGPGSALAHPWQPFKEQRGKVRED